MKKAKYNNKRNKYAVYLITFFIISCFSGNVDKRWEEGKGYIIKKGKYETYNKYYIIVDKQDSLVSFKIENSDGKEVLRSKYSFSDIHNWYLYYENDILWIYSSDIGTSYVVLSGSKEIKQIYITSENKFQIVNIPEKIRKDI